MKPNAGKYHLLLSSQDKELHLTIENEKIKNSNQEKLLGITTDNNFSCIPHVRKICRQASKKLHALARICTFMTQNKRKIIMKAFIESQFIYCPLVWMFHGNRGLNDAMNKTHERALRLVYSNTSSTYDELLEKDFKIHHRNLQKLAVEIFKIKTNIAPPILIDLFQNKSLSHSSNLRRENIFKTYPVNTVYNGTETVLYRAQQTWDIVPHDLKKSNSLAEFRRGIKLWKPVNCKCRLCKEYINGVGFINC